MTIQYIFHSGFVIEGDTAVVVLDYWMDPAGVMEAYAETTKKVYVLASHFHDDHFTPRILGWRQQLKDVTYILSKDILRHRRAKAEDADVWMVKGSTWSDANISVRATGSNDSGVSWIVELEGKRLFHAGDLCNWYARFLAEDPVPERIWSEEFGSIDPRAEERQFLGELKDIRKVTDHFDVAMFPVDGRIGNGYTLGGRQLMERFGVGLFVPMHFAASGFESAWRMKAYCDERGVDFWAIAREGEKVRR